MVDLRVVVRTMPASSASPARRRSSAITIALDVGEHHTSPPPPKSGNSPEWVFWAYGGTASSTCSPSVNSLIDLSFVRVRRARHRRDGIKPRGRRSAGRTQQGHTGLERDGLALLAAGERVGEDGAVGVALSVEGRAVDVGGVLHARGPPTQDVPLRPGAVEVAAPERRLDPRARRGDRRSTRRSPGRWGSRPPRPTRSRCPRRRSAPYRPRTGRCRSSTAVTRCRRAPTIRPAPRVPRARRAGSPRRTSSASA